MDDLDETTSLCDVKYKIVFLGEMAVGKTSIIDRFIRNEFNSKHMVWKIVIKQTVGIDFLAKNIIHKGFTYRMLIWDTAGQEKFRSLVPMYLRDAHCAVFVFDMSNKLSFTKIS